jgi:N-methylhydantoinase B
VRGGDGQIIQFRLDTRDEWLLNAVASRVDEGPEGLGGGAPGAPGKFHINGKPVHDHKKLTMQPGDVVLFETPGGGGYGQR